MVSNAMETSSTRKLWGVGTSRTLRAHWALIELGLVYKKIDIRPRSAAADEAGFLIVSPDKKVPVLQDGALTISESPAITIYLAELYSTADTRLIPLEIHSRARFFEWVSYISMELDATSLYVIRRHLDLAKEYGEAPAAVDAARDYFVRMVARAGRTLGDGRPYLLGKLFSVADILMVSCFDFADQYDAPLPSEILEYRARVSARPAYGLAMKANN
jgi:glutathione S-transferase